MRPCFPGNPEPSRVSAHPNSSPSSNDEIDLRELVLSLWRAKWLILLITAIVTAAAAAYAFLVSPTYEVAAKALPPDAVDLASYNNAYALLSLPTGGPADGPANASNGNPTNPAADLPAPPPGLTPDDAFAVFLRQLQSAQLRQAFFQQTYLPAHTDRRDKDTQTTLWAKLDNDLDIQASDSEATVTFSGHDPRHLDEWTRRYMNMAAQAAQRQLADQLNSTQQSRTHLIQAQIDSLRKIAQAKRKAEIVHLETALRIAQAIGLKTQSTPENPAVSYTGDTTYLRGSKAIEAEIALLKARTNDDPFIAQLPNLLYARAQLKSIAPDLHGLSAAHIDHVTSDLASPVKPHRPLVVALGALLGLILGIFVVLARRVLGRPAP